MLDSAVLPRSIDALQDDEQAPIVLRIEPLLQVGYPSNVSKSEVFRLVFSKPATSAGS
jgi:hypothetical protein